MKKSIIALAVLMVLTMVTALFVPVFAAKSDAIVFDLTVADPAMPGKNGQLSFAWSGAKVGTSGYDATEKAWKLENTKMLAGWSLGYEEFYLPEAIDYDTYQYCVISYKTVGMKAYVEGEGENRVGVNGAGAASIADLEVSDGVYTDYVLDTAFFNGTDKVLLGIHAYSGGTLASGAQLFIKYIAFFTSEDEANAFDSANYSGPIYEAKEESSTPESSAPESSAPESSAPESSAPESSTPESSTPESSAPEPSAPESSKPESSKPSADTGHGTLVGGAVVLFAAAAAVALVSKKR